MATLSPSAFSIASGVPPSYLTNPTATTAPAPTTTQQKIAVANATKPPVTKPPSEPTTLSSSNIDDKNQENISKINNYVTPGQVAGPDGFIRNSDSSFAEAPSDSKQITDEGGNTYWQSGGMNYALGARGGNVSSDPFVQGIYQQFSTLKSQMDETGAQQIESIRNQFDALIQEQRSINAGEEAGTRSLLLRGGSYQTGSSEGIFQSQVSYGLGKVATLVAKENDAIVNAKMAIQQNDMELLDKMLGIADEARKERQGTAQKLNDTMMAKRAIQQRESSVREAMASLGTTDVGEIQAALEESGLHLSADEINSTINSLHPEAKEVADIVEKLAEYGAPAEIRQQVARSGSKLDALKAAGTYYQNPMLRFQLKNAELDNQLKQAQIAKTQKETSLLGEPTEAERKETAAALKEAKAAVPIMKDKIATIDVLEKHPGMGVRVGPNALSRAPRSIIEALTRVGTAIVGGGAAGAAVGAPFGGVGAIPGAIAGGVIGGIGGVVSSLQGVPAEATGQGQDFAGGVHKLTSGLTIDALQDAKARGATFGALSDGELGLLAGSATALSDWEIKDSKGKGTGYWNIDEVSFKKEMDNIKMLTSRALEKSGQNVLTPDEQSVLDAINQVDVGVTDPSAYFK